MWQGDNTDASDSQAAVWAPRSPDELTMELQLACVHPRVCLMAASAGVGVPDPEDALSPLAHKKARLGLLVHGENIHEMLCIVCLGVGELIKSCK